MWGGTQRALSIFVEMSTVVARSVHWSSPRALYTRGRHCGPMPRHVFVLSNDSSPNRHQQFQSSISRSSQTDVLTRVSRRRMDHYLMEMHQQIGREPRSHREKGERMPLPTSRAPRQAAQKRTLQARPEMSPRNNGPPTSTTACIQGSRLTFSSSAAATSGGT